MAAFPLKRLLDIRAKRERTAATQLAGANDAATKAERAHDATVRHQRVSAEQLDDMAKSGVRVGEVRSLATVLSSLAAQVEASNAAKLDADAGVLAAQALLATTTTERRIIERLRERHEDATRHAHAAHDRAAMDAAALGRYLATRTNDRGEQ